MTEIATLLTAFWLGLITSISPCPLATNVAALSLLARRVGDRRRALAGALAYTAGRILAYLGIGLLILAGLATMPGVAAFLRQEILPLVGPLLILVGMAVLGWIPLPFDLRVGGAGLADRLQRYGWLGELLLGALFALSFCPISAALFFGSLLPLAFASLAPSLAVGVYGLGTALPVGVLALLLVVSTRMAARTLDRLQAIQRKVVLVTGVLLIAIGLWLTAKDTFGLLAG